MSNRERACNLLAAEMKKAVEKGGTGFVTRERLIKLLLKSRYSETAVSHLSGYVNDIRVYLRGELEVQQEPHSRYVRAWKLKNAKDFDSKGFNLKLEKAEVPIADRREQYKALKAERDQRAA